MILTNLYDIIDPVHVIDPIRYSLSIFGSLLSVPFGYLGYWGWYMWIAVIHGYHVVDSFALIILLAAESVVFPQFDTKIQKILLRMKMLLLNRPNISINWYKNRNRNVTSQIFIYIFILIASFMDMVFNFKRASEFYSME